MAQQKCLCKNFWKRISDWLITLLPAVVTWVMSAMQAGVKIFDDREYSYSDTDLHLVSGNSGKKSFDADFDRLSFRRFCGDIYAGWWRNFFYGKGRRDSLHFIILFRYLSGNRYSGWHSKNDHRTCRQDETISGSICDGSSDRRCGM